MPRRTDEDDDYYREDPDPSDMDAGDSADDQDLLSPCPHCRHMVYDDAERCPHCGQYTDNPQSAAGHPRWVIATVVALIALFLYFAWHGV